ncbi:MAG: hypothetical protein JF609_06760 [Verrucomicrobia bacterium]|nr:hypothetical protein [Verrucomicrobiota bacterium]
MSSTANSYIACPNCGAFLPSTTAELQALTGCRACQRPMEVAVFPAYERPIAVGVAAEKVVMEGEAACFYHPDNRAQVPCDACGRFLCALCDLDLNGKHFCPQCLEKAMQKNTLQSVERTRTRWDMIVFLLLLLPVIPCFLLLLPLTALCALVLIGVKWNAPRSLVSNVRVRFIIYAILGVLELIGGCVMWWNMFYNQR